MNMLTQKLHKGTDNQGSGFCNISGSVVVVAGKAFDSWLAYDVKATQGAACRNQKTQFQQFSSIRAFVLPQNNSN